MSVMWFRNFLQLVGILPICLAWRGQEYFKRAGRPLGPGKLRDGWKIHENMLSALKASEQQL